MPEATGSTRRNGATEHVPVVVSCQRRCRRQRFQHGGTEQQSTFRLSSRVNGDAGGNGFNTEERSNRARFGCRLRCFVAPCDPVTSVSSVLPSARPIRGVELG